VFVTRDNALLKGAFLFKNIFGIARPSEMAVFFILSNFAETRNRNANSKKEKQVII